MRVLVLSPRTAPGQLTAQAWDLVRSGVPVVAALDDAHAQALRDAGVDVAIGEPPAQRDAIWVPAPGDVTWPAHVPADVEVVHGSLDLPGARLLDVVAVMGRLRRECAWTREQTHASLSRYLLEETYETLEALDDEDADLLREELGDLLMQVVFHSAIAAERPEGGWDVDDVAAGIAAKLVRRNPHVFADGPARTPEEIDAAWQAVKAVEKPREHPLEGIASTLPALALATKALERVPDVATDGDDIGSRLLALVAEAREAGVDPEAALRRTVRDRAEP
ncbi:MazG family protein [Aeromicrobium sp. CTD01-1L150]|uniref:MazG family protein n=1 Tax=Aeromicrobium sp. CTD01-1L150 TaxID=3341830 RepID=UPI0035C141D3